MNALELRVANIDLVSRFDNVAIVWLETSTCNSVKTRCPAPIVSDEFQ